MNHICTWFCADQKGEESGFPQSGERSSGASHQNIYWRCLIVFFITSRRVNKEEKHILFTNAPALPVVDDLDIAAILSDLRVEVVQVGFSYKTPRGYYGSFQNQFFEFSILETIARSDRPDDDLYLILDSDCVFNHPAASLFSKAQQQGFLSFETDSPPDYDINGLSRLEMKDLFADLLGRAVGEIPSYHLGEFLLCSAGNIRKLTADFRELWPVLLQRHALGLKKLNEEAHTLSYLYFKNGLKASADNHFIRRIWTNPVFYRNVLRSDQELVIWHLPAEKIFGIARLFRLLTSGTAGYGRMLSGAQFRKLLQQHLGIPTLTAAMKIEYYSVSYYRALKKRLLRLTGTF